MNLTGRTDLAIEKRSENKGAVDGVTDYLEVSGDISVSGVRVLNKTGADALGKPEGEYVTVSFPPLSSLSDFEELRKALIRSLKRLLPDTSGTVLVAGLGNTEITPDAVGPLTARGILATRHIMGGFAEEIGLSGLRSVAAIAPNVLGKTGIEAAELISAAVETVKPCAVIAVDALAARDISRLCRTVQLTDTGISPGSGVKNSRKELSRKTLGVPVVAVGIPTVVDAAVFTENPDGADMLVTPRDIDLLTDRASEMLSQTLNLFLQPELDPETVLSLV